MRHEGIPSNFMRAADNESEVETGPEYIISKEDARILVAAENICAKYEDLFNEVSRNSEQMPEIRGYADTAMKFDIARDFLQSALISAEIRSDQKAFKHGN